nr:hypothetical protein [Desulfobacteraceae bacterium]
ILLETIKTIKSKIDPIFKKRKDLYADFVKKYVNRKEKEIIENIIDLRGFLHHHSAKNKKIWHPAEQRKFEVDALVLHQICYYIISKKINNVLFQTTRVKDFINTDVKTKKGQKVNWEEDKRFPSND